MKSASMRWIPLTLGNVLFSSSSSSSSPLLHSPPPPSCLSYGTGSGQLMIAFAVHFSCHWAASNHITVPASKLSHPGFSKSMLNSCLDLGSPSFGGGVQGPPCSA